MGKFAIGDKVTSIWESFDGEGEVVGFVSGSRYGDASCVVQYVNRDGATKFGNFHEGNLLAVTKREMLSGVRRDVARVDKFEVGKGYAHVNDDISGDNHYVYLGRANGSGVNDCRSYKYTPMVAWSAPKTWSNVWVMSVEDSHRLIGEVVKRLGASGSCDCGDSKIGERGRMRGPNIPDTCEDYAWEWDRITGRKEPTCDNPDRGTDFGFCPYDGNRAMCDEQQGDHIEAYREEM